MSSWKTQPKRTRLAFPFLCCRIPVDILQYWEKSFNSLLINPDGVRLFEEYLKTELSEENIQFWKACERFKMIPDHQIEAEAAVIYDEFIGSKAPKLVGQ